MVLDIVIKNQYKYFYNIAFQTPFWFLPEPIGSNLLHFTLSKIGAF